MLIFRMIEKWNVKNTVFTSGCCCKICLRRSGVTFVPGSIAVSITDTFAARRIFPQRLPKVPVAKVRTISPLAHRLSTAICKTPVPEQPVTPAQPETPTLGTVTVVAEALNVRSSASMDGAIVGTVSANEQYQVLETYNDGTQNWYRIGDGQWITDGGLGYVNYVQ